MSDQLSQYQQEPQRDDEITLKDIFRTLQGLLGSWPFLLGGMLVGVVIAFIVNRYIQDTFEISTTVAIEEADNPLASAEGALNIGFSWGGSGLIDTRQAVLKSYAHNSRVAHKLGWEVKQFVEGRLNRREEYLPKHYQVVFDPEHVQLLGAEWSIEFNETGIDIAAVQVGNFQLYNYSLGEPAEFTSPVELDDETYSYAYGEWIESSHYRFKIERGEKLDEFLEGNSLTTSNFQFQTYDAIANWGMENLNMEFNEKQQSSLLTLKMAGYSKPQLADYMNASIQELQSYELRQKNLMMLLILLILLTASSFR